MDRCPECGSMRYSQVGPDNGYGAQYYCDSCGYENDAKQQELDSVKERMIRKNERRTGRRRNR